jgi:hypothetical protein
MTTGFFAGEMDYVYFLYGLAFILLAANAWRLNRRAGNVLPWGWLALFGLLHGLAEWSDMLLLSRRDSLGLTTIHLVLMASSFVCLFEFGRRNLGLRDSARLGFWILIGLIALAGVGAFAGMRGLNAASRYSLGLTGGILAAVSVWRRRTKHREGRSPPGLSSPRRRSSRLRSSTMIPSPGRPAFPFKSSAHFSST